MEKKKTYCNSKIIQRQIKSREGMRLFKPTVVKKTSGLMAFLLLFSILMPVLAFADAWFEQDSIKLDGNTITGVVYTDDHNLDTIQIDILNGLTPIGTVSSVTYETYKTVNGAVYKFFEFTHNLSQYYNSLKLSVGDDVYIATNIGTAPGGGGGFWGGGGGGVTTGNEISVPSDGNVNSGTLQSALNTYSNVILKLAGDTAIIPASALLNADGKTVTVVADNGATYTYPINVDLLNEWAQQLNIAASDMKLTISLEKVTGATLTAIEQAVQDLGATMLADPIDFTVAISSGTQSIDITDMEQYVHRTLPLSQAADSNKSTGVVFDPATGSLSFVPSIFESTNDDHLVDIAHRSNNIYTAIEYTRNFSDVISHWAKSDIELLTNKLIANGMTASTFEPEREVTRAEFAALIVRALGLSKISGASTFSDVQANDWFAAEVNAAVQAGIVDGYPDGTFKPNNKINREELAAMVVRALNFAGIDTGLTSAEQSQILSSYVDANSIVWAQAEIAQAIDSGIVNGMTAVTLAPRDDATRAQAITMIKRYLGNAGFIN